MDANLQISRRSETSKPEMHFGLWVLRTKAVMSYR
jgi:hypothetical protein